MRMRVVVADQSEASMYELQTDRNALELVTRLSDPKAHLHDRDFNSDRPGRVFDHAAAPGKRRGATAHHATGSERRPRRLEAEHFATQIAEVLDRGLQRGEFDTVVLMAGPFFLGLLRRALSPSVSAVVRGEITKDLVHQSADAILEYLPLPPFGTARVGR